MRSERVPRFSPLVGLIFAGLLLGVSPTMAQPTIVSTVPANGETDVATTTTVTFTFSTAMNTTVSAAFFFDAIFMTPFPTLQTWSMGNTVLTCTPLAPFPADELINWFATGQDAGGNPLAGLPLGSFSTGTGGPGTIGTNALTTYSVGKVHHYNQTSAGAPTLDPLTPYGFSGVTALKSNHTATIVELTLPTGAVSNLTHLPPPSADVFLMTPFYTSLSSFDAAYPAGDYTFDLQGSPNQTAGVTLPSAASLPQPGTPRVTNYVAAQSVDPNQTFVLGWEVLPPGNAGDYIDVDIGLNFGAPNPGLPGALSGTARTFTIPAGTLLPDTVYLSRIGFFRFTGSTNSEYAAAAYRATYIEFNLITTPTSSPSLVLTNAAFTAGIFNFDVLCANCPSATVEYRTNLAVGQWQTLFSTNNPPNLFHAVAPQSATNRVLFFRARTGM